MKVKIGDKVHDSCEEAISVLFEEYEQKLLIEQFGKGQDIFNTWPGELEEYKDFDPEKFNKELRNNANSVSSKVTNNEIKELLKKHENEDAIPFEELRKLAEGE